MIKKLLTITLIAAFCLATVCQADAFAWSPKKAFKKAVKAVSSVIKPVTKPIAKLVSPKTNPIAAWFKKKVVDPIINPIKLVLARGLKEFINVISLATSHTSEVRQQWRMWTGRMGIYNYSDHDFIRHATNDEKVRQALLLLKEKAPDVFRWLKKNLAVIKVSNGLGGHSGEFKFCRGRVIFLDKGNIENSAIEAIAGFIVHETSHLVDYFKTDLGEYLREDKWESEFRADQAMASVMNRLGAGEGWKKLKFPVIKVIDGTDVEATHQYDRWSLGNRSTGGYWKLETTGVFRGILKGSTVKSLKTDYTIYNPAALAQATWDYSDRLVELDYSLDEKNPTLKVIGIKGPQVVKTIWLEQDGTLKKQDKIKDATGKEMITEEVLDNLNAKINSATISESVNRNIVVSTSGVDAAGNALSINTIVNLNGRLIINQIETTYTTGNVARSITKKSYDGISDMLGREETKNYNFAGNLIHSATSFHDANGNLYSTELFFYDASGTLIEEASITYDASGNTLGSTRKTYDATGKLTQTVVYDANGNVVQTIVSPIKTIVSPIITTGRAVSPLVTTKGAGDGATMFAKTVVVTPNPAPQATGSTTVSVPDAWTQKGSDGSETKGEVLKRDAAGRLIEYKTTTTGPNGSSVTTSHVTSIDYDKVLQAKSVAMAASLKAATAKSNNAVGATIAIKMEFATSLPLPPVGGPQGGIAPDVVNPNQGQAGPAVAAGGK